MGDDHGRRERNFASKRLAHCATVLHDRGIGVVDLAS